MKRLLPNSLKPKESVNFDSYNQQGLILWLLVIIILAAQTYISYTEDQTLLLAIGAIGLIMAVVGLGLYGWLSLVTDNQSEERKLRRLKTELLRANAVYKFSSHLSGTLDYTTILNRALDVGELALSKRNKSVNIISTALLFRNTDNLLHVAVGKYMNRQDYQTTVAAQDGILAQALDSHKPIIGGKGTEDPELRQFASFYSAQSLLALPLRQGYESYGVMIYGAPYPSAFDRHALEAMAAISTQISVALKNAVLYQGILDDKERIVSIDEQARKKLSRDLHDGPTQTIALISSISSVIKRYVEREEIDKAVTEIEKIRNLAQKTTKEIRVVLFSLRPLVLENRGLLPALEELAKKTQETYGQPVTFEADPVVEEYLDDDDKGTIFYIVEEAINNAAKHAEADMIWTRLLMKRPYILLEIEDNGRGFNVQEINTDYHKRGSFGMVNLRERTEMLRGDFSINSEIGRGTKITVVIPINDDETLSKSPFQQSQVDPHDTVMANNLNVDEEVSTSTSSSSGESGWQDILNEIRD